MISEFQPLHKYAVLDLLQSKYSQEELITDINESCKYSLDMINMLLNTYRYENGEQVFKSGSI